MNPPAPYARLIISAVTLAWSLALAATLAP